MKSLEVETIRHIRHFGPIRLSGCSEPMRQALINLGMYEPPLVEVDGNWVNLTEAGRKAVWSHPH